MACDNFKPGTQRVHIPRPTPLGLILNENGDFLQRSQMFRSTATFAP